MFSRTHAVELHATNVLVFEFTVFPPVDVVPFKLTPWGRCACVSIVPSRSPTRIEPPKRSRIIIYLRTSEVAHVGRHKFHQAFDFTPRTCPASAFGLQVQSRISDSCTPQFLLGIQLYGRIAVLSRVQKRNEICRSCNVLFDQMSIDVQSQTDSVIR